VYSLSVCAEKHLCLASSSDPSHLEAENLPLKLNAQMSRLEKSSVAIACKKIGFKEKDGEKLKQIELFSLTG